MKHYKYEEIKANGDCIRFAKEVLNLAVNGDNRCAAVWRGGKNPNVALEKDKWYDHVEGVGGSILDLCAMAKFGGIDQMSIRQAQEVLGDWLGLTPRAFGKPLERQSGRYEELIAEGYREIIRYDYNDPSGKLIHQVVRLEHPDPNKKKQFLQRCPEHWGVKGMDLVLYNMSGFVNSNWVVIIEGEKDAETLKAMSVPATTVCGGTKKWHKRYCEHFKNKQVVIIPDNDKVGIGHARMIAADLLQVTSDVKMVIVSKLPKGDVTDFMQKENGSWEQISKMIVETPLLKPEDLRDVNDQFAVEEAKALNKSEFRNFTPTEKTIGKRTKITKIPKQINDLISDVHRRFIGFPRKVGEQLFDHDRNNKRIVYIHKQASLFAWIARKSKQQVVWSREDGCVSKEELHEGIIADAIKYEAISRVPDWPTRDDVYYAHDAIPSPDSNHKYFKKLMSFFAPANKLHEVMLKSFVTAPLFYLKSIPRPLWIIDSEDGAGTGKTTIVEIVASLYQGTPISTSSAELKKSFVELIKRVVSSEGRQARLLLLDNITGTFSCPELADMVTKTSISGRPAYGRGEEVRPNNLTYVITANSANVDNDLASRAYYIMVKRPSFSKTWRQNILNYVEDHRLEILADIIDILNTHEPFVLPPITRCPEFETMILQAHCKDTEEYSSVVKMLIDNKAETNVEEDLARRVEEVIRHNLIEVNTGTNPIINPSNDCCFIRTEVIEKWIKKAEIMPDRNNTVQIVRNLANIGLLSIIAKKPKRYPHNGKNKASGCMWQPLDNPEHVQVVGSVGAGKIGIIEIVKAR